MKKHFFIRIVELALALTLVVGLSVPSEAYEIPEDFTDMTAETVILDFIEQNQLKGTNFAISYYNTVTGEGYAWNDDWFSIAASTYKLPLNMYFYEMQQAGEITGDTIITWTGRTLDEIHEKSIVNSNNELSEALMYYWGDHVSYKQNMRKYFTMTDEEIDPSYWQANWYCVRMMMDCLKYLYENQENFEELIGYMKEAMPGQYFKRGVTEYEVAHKYGAVQIYYNDVGIIYTPQPYLLAVYTAGIYGEDACAEAAKALTAYTVWQAEHNPVEPEEAEEPEEPEHQVVDMVVEEVEPELPEEPAALEEPSAETPAESQPEVLPAAPMQMEEPPAASRDWLPWSLGAAALLVILVLRRLLKKKRT